MWFETHAHLGDSKFDADRDAALERAFAAGVSTLVEIADGPLEWEKARVLAERYADRVWWAAGLHPYYADQGSSEIFRGLKECVRHPRFVAIGEVGLDYAKSTVDKSQQAKTFTTAIELALEVDKPLVIHCRDAFVDLIPLLVPYFAQRADKNKSPGVIHCFSGTTDDARRIIEMGFFLGVDGPITYPNAKALRATLSELSLDHLVLETDAPYLPPQTHRGQRNEPALVISVGTALAELFAINVKSVAEKTARNAKNLYRLK
jgi:TatD DNase family protein